MHSEDKDEIQVEDFNPHQSLAVYSRTHAVWYGPYEMSRVDWRWAAQKGFYDPKTKQWNSAAGGYEAYARQRAQHKSARKPRSTESTLVRSTRESESTASNNDQNSEALSHSSDDFTSSVERPLPFLTCSVTFDQVKP